MFRKLVCKSYDHEAFSNPTLLAGHSPISKVSIRVPYKDGNRQDNDPDPGLNFRADLGAPGLHLNVDVSIQTKSVIFPALSFFVCLSFQL